MPRPLKDVIRPWIPPAALDLTRRRKGSYAGLALTDLTWAEALEACEGYHDPVILENVERATRQALGDGGYERDGVVLELGEVHWPVLGPLFEARAAVSGTLRVIDIGGSLASKWFQHRQFHLALAPMAWAVVEQPQVVRTASQWLQTNELTFHGSITEAHERLGGVDVVMFSSSLQYLPNPMSVLGEAASLAGHSIVIDRMPTWSETTEHLAIQSVGLYAKPVRYPCWVMSRPAVSTTLNEVFDIVATWDEVMPFPATPSSAHIGWWGVLASGRRGR
jgi:putative methyltransferase (TIGR04325 family)